MVARLVFLALIVAVAIPSPWMSPPLALVGGVGFGLLFDHPFPGQARRWAKRLLPISVVGLGFAMNLGEVLRAGADGFLYTLVGISFALGLGALLGKLLAVPAKTGFLISVGTAICGGSAIAAAGPAVAASDEEMSVSIGTVFLLNAVGLVVFPPLGEWLGLSQRQFGLWAALAIHDTSSVVGAAAKFGAGALTVATTVKLARALWIVPVTLAAASVVSWQRRANQEGAPSKTAIPLPWFILFFLGAAILRSYLPAGQAVYPHLVEAAKAGLTITLFLIGTGMSTANLRAVGVRPLVMGVLLWVCVAAGSLAIVRA